MAKEFLQKHFINEAKAAINRWSGSGGTAPDPVIQPLTVTENGTYTAPDGVDGYSPVNVEVASSGGSTGGEEWIGDGKTHLWIKIAAEGRMTVPIGFTQTVANGVTIDWGDGSDPQTLSGTGYRGANHTYDSIGEYVITFDVADGCTFSLGYQRNYTAMGYTNNNNIVYYNMLQKVEIGRDVTSIAPHAFDGCLSLSSIYIPDGVTSIGEYAFYRCISLLSIDIPDSVTSIGNQAFYECYSLIGITIPEGVTSIGSSTFGRCYSFSKIYIHDGVMNIGTNAFDDCWSLASITIPEGVTSISSSTFADCGSLANIVIPDSVTSINNYAFKNCYGMKYYDFTKHAVVPTLSASNALYAASDCEIRVPAALYDEWIAATNWSTYASKIVAV